MCERVTIGFGLLLIRSKSGENFASQSCSVITQNQLLFDTRVKTAQKMSKLQLFVFIIILLIATKRRKRKPSQKTVNAFYIM